MSTTDADVIAEALAEVIANEDDPEWDKWVRINAEAKDECRRLERECRLLRRELGVSRAEADGWAVSADQIKPRGADLPPTAARWLSVRGSTGATSWVTQLDPRSAPRPRVALLRSAGPRELGERRLSVALAEAGNDRGPKGQAAQLALGWSEPWGLVSATANRRS